MNSALDSLQSERMYDDVLAWASQVVLYAFGDDPRAASFSVNGPLSPQPATVDRREGIEANHSRPPKNKAIDRGTARPSQPGGLATAE